MSHALAERVTWPPGSRSSWIPVTGTSSRLRHAWPARLPSQASGLRQPGPAVIMRSFQQDRVITAGNGGEVVTTRGVASRGERPGGGLEARVQVGLVHLRRGDVVVEEER